MVLCELEDWHVFTLSWIGFGADAKSYLLYSVNSNGPGP